MSNAIQAVTGSGTSEQNVHSLTEERREGSTTKARRGLSRVAGLLYLGVGVFGGFAVGFVFPKVYIAGDAATTAANVVANSGLLRMGVVADLIQATLWVFLAMTLYALLRHVNTNAARAMVILVAIGAAITCLNDVFAFAALRVATEGPYAAGLGATGSNAVVLLLLDIQHYGFFGIAQIFFGLWLAPLGYLAYKSGMFPKALGVVLVAASVSYLVDVLALYLVPDVGLKFHSFVVTPVATIAEVWMLGYLLVKGVKSTGPNDLPTVTVASAPIGYSA